MKKLLLVVLALVTFIFTGCDNNEGPFEVRRENGHKVLYSNGKLAKGMISSTWYDYNSGESVVTSTYYVEKGIPAGDFILYDRKGNLLVKFEGKTKDGLFVGKMTGEKYKSKGEYNLNPDWLLTYDGNAFYQAVNLYKDVLYTGKIDSETEKYEKLNGKRNGRVEIYDSRTGVKTEEIWKDGEEKISKRYYNDGKLMSIDDYVKDETGNYTSIFFTKDGKLHSISLYPNLRAPSHYSNLLLFSGSHANMLGNYFKTMTEEEVLAKYSKKYNFKIIN